MLRVDSEMSTASPPSSIVAENTTSKPYIPGPVDEVIKILNNCGVSDAKEKAQEIGIKTISYNLSSSRLAACCCQWKPIIL